MIAAAAGSTVGVSTRSEYIQACLAWFATASRGRGTVTAQSSALAVVCAHCNGDLLQRNRLRCGALATLCCMLNIVCCMLYVACYVACCMLHPERTAVRCAVCHVQRTAGRLSKAAGKARSFVRPSRTLRACRSRARPTFRST